ncbi:MFS transporter [Halorubrum sp. DTA46]|uniref:MFS transporter n=1 Tax=Halorubrum sp. DTA46 TaxID=3402162 RepID=UPI003AAF2089
MRWRYRETVLALCTLAFFATMVARMAISPVVPSITAEFEVSNTVIGFALTGLWASYFLTQYPSGVFADRFGERSVILVSIGGTAVASLAIGISPNIAVFVGAILLLGVTTGLHYSVATSLLTRTHDNVGTAIGLHSTGGPVAGLVTPVVVAWIAVRYGWRIGVTIGAVVAVVVFVGFAWKVRPTPPRTPDRSIGELFEYETIRNVLARPPIAFTVCIAVLSEFVWQSTASFLPTFLIAHHGLSTTAAGIGFGGYFLVHGVVQIAVGRLSDHYGRDRLIAGCMIAGIAGFSTLVVGSGLAAIATGITLVGIGMSWISAVLPRFIDNLSTAEQGVGFGLVRTVYGLLGASGSVSVGIVADAFSWGAAFGLLTVPLSLVLCAFAANYATGLRY